MVSHKHADAAGQADLPFWKRSHYLDRMTFRELVVAYFQHYTILTYLGLTALCVAAWAVRPAGLWQTLAAIAAGVLIYPLVWHLLHQYVLHSKWMWKSKLLSPTWKRIHYDHHQDPNRLDVLFGSLTNTIPTLLIATVPVGYLITGNWSGSLTAAASAMLFTCVYEFCHCIQHLNFQPRSAWLKRIKKLHMAHHFHNENGNYGIISFWPDKVLGTHYEDMTAMPRSRTVYNLGYDEAEAARYPWVAALTPSRGRRRAAAPPAE